MQLLRESISGSLRFGFKPLISRSADGGEGAHITLKFIVYINTPKTWCII